MAPETKGGTMKMRLIFVGLVVLVLAAAVYAAGPKTYQVTGPVLEIKGDVIVVQNKDGEKWEVAKDAATKITGDLKVGAKVTIEYTMTAKKVEVKGEAAKPAEPKKAEPKAEPKKK
jgi:hypothetical protein